MSVGYFSTVVASYVFISLWNSLMTWSFMWHLWHVFALVFSLGFIVLYALSKNYKTILSIIPMFLTSVSSTSFASPPISWSSAIYKICHETFASSSMTLLLLFEEWALSLEVAAFDLPCLLVILILFIKAPAAPVLETLGLQVNLTLAVFSSNSWKKK